MLIRDLSGSFCRDGFGNDGESLIVFGNDAFLPGHT